MAVRNFAGAAQEIHPLQQFVAELRVPAHHRHLFVVQLARLDQHRIRQGQLADVVQQRTEAQVAQRLAMHADQPRQTGGHAHHPIGMVAGFAVADVHRRHQHAQGLGVAVQQLAVDGLQPAQVAADHPVQQRPRARHEQPALDALQEGQLGLAVHQRVQRVVGQPYPQRGQQYVKQHRAEWRADSSRQLPGGITPPATCTPRILRAEGSMNQRLAHRCDPGLSPSAPRTCARRNRQGCRRTRWRCCRHARSSPSRHR